MWVGAVTSVISNTPITERATNGSSSNLSRTTNNKMETSSHSVIKRTYLIRFVILIDIGYYGLTVTFFT